MTALPDGSLLVAGGCVVDGCTTATSSAYLVTEQDVERVGALAQARDGHTATALKDGRVLVVGGWAAEGQPPLSSAEVYDPATRRWTPVSPLSTGRGGHAAAMLADGRVVVAGGWVGPSTYTSTTELFDPTTGRFTRGPDLPVAVDALAATSLADGSVLVVGGQQAPGVASDLAVRIYPDGTLENLAPLATARFKHTVVTLASGRALVIGGTSDDVNLLDTTEVFEPERGRFLPGPKLTTGRYKLSGSATVLPDGRVAVAGGGSGVEILDVRTGTSRAVVAAGTTPASFSTTGLLGDRLLVLGGYDEQIQLTGTKLLLDPQRPSTLRWLRAGKRQGREWLTSATAGRPGSSNQSRRKDVRGQRTR
jgi:Kelch motif protein